VAKATSEFSKYAPGIRLGFRPAIGEQPLATCQVSGSGSWVPDIWELIPGT